MAALKRDQLKSMTDEALMQAYQKGQTLAFDELVDRYAKDIYAFLVRFSGSTHAADDIFQDAFLQLHLSAGQFDTKKRFKPWFFTVSANKARDYLRKTSRHKTSSYLAPWAGDGGEVRMIDLMAGDFEMPEDVALRQEKCQQIKDCVNLLPDFLREVLELVYFQRFAYRQAAQTLDLPLGTVKSRLHSAVAMFGDLWKKQLADSAQEENQERCCGE